MPSLPLKDRAWRVRVAGLEFTELHVDFEVFKSLKHEPNTCTLKVYNLSATSRATIEQLNIYDPKRSKSATAKAATQTGVKKGNITTEILAGYANPGPSLVFTGQLRRGLSTWDGDTWTTVVEGEDGGRTVFDRRVSNSYPPGTPKLQVISALAEAMGVGLGNIAEVLPELAGAVFSSGTVVDGCAADEMKRLLRSSKLQYSVQNGAMQFTRNGAGAAGLVVQAYPLSELTGLVGKPARNATGEIQVTSLLVPGIVPGGYIALTSKEVQGLFRVMSVRTVGSSYGTEWYHQMLVLPA